MYTLHVEWWNVYNMEPYSRYLWRPRTWITFFVKLLYEHKKLTQYSIMNVKLGTQILSSKVSKTLTWYGPPKAAGTTKFCLLMDSFFDVMNIRNIQSHEFEWKPFLVPFTSVNDDWFGWLQNIFLKYFEDWLTSIEQHPGNFSTNARSNMFISWQAFEGLKIIVHLIIEAVIFLLQHHLNLVNREQLLHEKITHAFVI